jgi:hypothetical protein
MRAQLIWEVFPERDGSQAFVQKNHDRLFCGCIVSRDRIVRIVRIVRIYPTILDSDFSAAPI